MHKAKIKFHEPTLQQLQNQKMNQVFQMLKKQQQGISALLQKYQNTQKEDLDQYFSFKIKNNKLKQSKQKKDQSRKSRSLNKSISKSKLQLPQMKIIKKQNQRLFLLAERKKKRQSHTIELGKTSLRKQLQQVYFQRKNIRQKSLGYSKRMKRSQTKLQKSRIPLQYSGMLLNSTSPNRHNQSSKQKIISATSSNLATAQTRIQTLQSDIPRPLGINNSLMMLQSNKRQASDPSDSDEEQFPLAYYEREFKAKMTGQCIEQINYLYFSKNESIKDWSQSLLAMFQKHDKQIVGLRKKMRYLQKFDDKFFATDIYKNQ